MSARNDGLLDLDAARAVETGLAATEWHCSDVSRRDMKAPMLRSNGPATRDTLLSLGAMVVFAGTGIWLCPSWWFVPFWLSYGVRYRHRDVA